MLLYCIICPTGNCDLVNLVIKHSLYIWLWISDHIINLWSHFAWRGYLAEQVKENSVWCDSFLLLVCIWLYSCTCSSVFQHINAVSALWFYRRWSTQLVGECWKERGQTLANGMTVIQCSLHLKSCMVTSNNFLKFSINVVFKVKSSACGTCMYFCWISF